MKQGKRAHASVIEHKLTEVYKVYKYTSVSLCVLSIENILP